jgi:hypothetical protein
VVVSQPSHMASQPGGAASTALAFYSSFGHMSSKPRAKLTYNMVGRPAGPSALSAWGLTHSVFVSNTPLW